MKKVVFAVCAAIALAGCSSIRQDDTWKAVAQGDEFSDSKQLIVTTGDYSSGGYVMTRGMRYYPVIGRAGGEIYFGIMSGGKYKIPVGSVQVRIDQNKTWDISISDTPESLVGKLNTLAPVDYGLKGEQAELVKRAQEQAMGNYGRAMSPITAVGGEKAKEIIRQMLAGRKMIYRTATINQPSSTTGNAVLDESFAKALRGIGISESDLK